MNPPKHSWTLIQRIQSFCRYGTFWRLKGYFERQYNLGVPIQLYKWRSLELCPSNGIHHWYVWITRRTLIALMHENWSASFRQSYAFTHHDFYFHTISTISASAAPNLWLILWIVREVEFPHNGLRSYTKFKLPNLAW